MIFEYTCHMCENPYKTTSRKQKYCSPKCSHIGSHRVEHPSKDQLKQEIYKTSWCALGRKYGVSNNTVKKWAIQYNLI